MRLTFFELYGIIPPVIWMKQEIKQQIGQSVQGFRLPRYQEIPDVGLYLEQAT